MPERFPSAYVTLLPTSAGAHGFSSLAFKELDMTIKIAFIAIIQCIQVYSFILDHSFAFTGLKFGIIILTKSAFI